MKRWNIAKTTLAATLFAVTASYGQSVIFSDDFEDGTLDAWNWNYGEAVGDAANVDDSGDRVMEIAHVQALSRSGVDPCQVRFCGLAAKHQFRMGTEAAQGFAGP